MSYDREFTAKRKCYFNLAKVISVTAESLLHWVFILLRLTACLEWVGSLCSVLLTTCCVEQWNVYGVSRVVVLWHLSQYTLILRRPTLSKHAISLNSIGEIEFSEEVRWCHSPEITLAWLKPLFHSVGHQRLSSIVVWSSLLFAWHSKLFWVSHFGLMTLVTLNMKSPQTPPHCPIVTTAFVLTAA